MIKCNCGENNFQIMEYDKKVKILCAGCGRVILDTDTYNLKMTGFERDADTKC